MRVICCFTHRNAPYTNDAEHSVNKFRDALKGDPINGYGHVRVGKGPLRRLAQKNAADAAEWFGEMAADILRSEGIKGRPIFVPFPDSKRTGQRASKTKRLADAIAKRFAGDVADVLHFQNEMPSSHSQGGPRDALTIYQNLFADRRIDPKRPCILIDDVCTKGGHLAAGAAELERVGANVVLAVCALKAEQGAVADPFARVETKTPPFSPK